MEVLNSMEHLPRHNVLLAGVQFLMLRDGCGELGEYYPNLSDRTRDRGDIAGPFEEFVLAHAEELAEIGRTRYTQTNECRRCVALLPALWMTPAERFHLVDFGTSAGLNLHLDRYRYRWESVEWGPPASPVHLETEMRGASVTPRAIDVVTRTGLDLNPIDPADPDDRAWLEALVWPEHDDRRVRLRAALDVAASHPSHLVAGDAMVTLGEALAQVPSGEPVVVINSFVLIQFDDEGRSEFETIIEEARLGSPVYRVSMEWLDRDATGADVAIDVGEGLEQVGMGHPHGEWLELYARP